MTENKCTNWVCMISVMGFVLNVFIFPSPGGITGFIIATALSLFCAICVDKVRDQPPIDQSKMKYLACPRCGKDLKSSRIKCCPDCGFNFAFSE